MTLLLILVRFSFICRTNLPIYECKNFTSHYNNKTKKTRWFHRLNMKSESCFMQMHHTIKTAL